MNKPAQPQLTDQERKIMSQTRDHTIFLSALEVSIIEEIRKIEFGSLTIFMKDGVPIRSEKLSSEMIVPTGFRSK